MWGKMRIFKVSPEKYANAVKTKAEHGEYMKVPSSKDYIFTGIMMPAGLWVPWPDNLTEEEMKKYTEMYGTIPDLVTPRRARE